MGQDGPHPKRVRHFDDPGHFHELTFPCYRRRPLLTGNAWRGELSRSIDRAMIGQRYRLVAFVYMGEHVHLIVHPLAEATGIARSLRAMKRAYSYRIKQQLVAAKADLLDRLTVRQRPGIEALLYWQEGPGYDRNLTRAKTVLSAIDYVHLNPVRRGLCEAATDWRWSSAKHYSPEGPSDDAVLSVVHGMPGESYPVGS